MKMPITMIEGRGRLRALYEHRRQRLDLSIEKLLNGGNSKVTKYRGEKLKVISGGQLKID